MPFSLTDEAEDCFNNRRTVRYTDKIYILDIHLSIDTISSDHVQNCRDLIQHLFVPNHDVLQNLFLLTGIGGDDEQPESIKYTYYGASSCTSSVKCLKDVTLEQIDEFCNSCDDKKLCRIRAFISR